jgi:hypothetical protein
MLTTSPPPTFVIQHRAGRNCPRLTCGRCGDLITDVKMAGIVWPPEYRDGSASGAMILCKVRNCLMAQRWRDWPWMPLKNYLVWLLMNTGAPTVSAITKLAKDCDRYSWP